MVVEQKHGTFCMCPHNSILFTCVYLCVIACDGTRCNCVCVCHHVFFGVMLILLHARVYNVIVCTVNPIILIPWLHVVNVC